MGGNFDVLSSWAMECLVRFIGPVRADVLGRPSGHMASRFAYSAGGARTEAETMRMMTEKVAALAEAQVAATTAALTGSKGHRVMKKVSGVYAKRVGRNKRRLAK